MEGNVTHLRMFFVALFLGLLLAFSGGAVASPPGAQPIEHLAGMDGACALDTDCAELPARVALPTAALATAAVSDGPAVAVANFNPDDPTALISLVLQIVGARQWLLLVPVLLVLAIYALRRFGSRWLPWLETARGGAVLSLLSVFGLSLWAAATAPGAAKIGQIVVAALGFFLTNELTHKALKPLFWPDGPARAKGADAAGAALEADPGKTPAQKVNDAVNGK